MRLVCLHADTVDALKRLNIQFTDLTPNGLWSSQYHLLGLTPDQVDALEVFQVEAEDITPAQMIETGTQTAAAASAPSVSRAASAESRRPEQAAAGEQMQGRATRAAAAGGGEPEVATAGVAGIAGTTSDQTGSGQMRAATSAESEVPLSQSRDAESRGGEAKVEGKAAAQPSGQSAGAQKNAGGKGGIPVPQAQGRKGQQAAPAQGGGQRYGTTRLRISVAGKYTEATVANGKIVVAGRTFDSPDQAAAELTKSRGDWTFWEYYDSADGKWRMLTRDWDTVLKSAAPGGR